ncbi:uncharacterized protein LOC110687526 [Chenopodium quinoa]|uniref:uncharacterized protein LOC110687526 n=1 Tax=Chenopodium quinoa TaxID=63459 RepID=UPI000B7709E3|nr:uncharacterized protein LOC110687526 [Chenopodium quinoa]
MELPLDNEDDFLYWKYHPSGKYTVKTGYFYLSKELGSNTTNCVEREQEFIKLIWRMNIQPKWKLFLWKLSHDGIAVKENLAKRGMRIETDCDRCREGEENSQHLFRYCTQAKEVWEMSPLDVFPDSLGSISLKEWIHHYILLYYSEDGKQGGRWMRFIATLWGLWKARNARCFRNAVGTSSQVRDFIDAAIQDHEHFIYRAGILSEEEAIGRDDPTLPPGFICVQLGKERTGFDDFRVEVDGSWDKTTTRVGIGWAIKDNGSGGETGEGGKYGVAASALQCEAWACLEALRWARSTERNEILVLTDSLSLLNNLQGNSCKEVSITWCLKGLKEVGALFQRCTILKVQRDQVQRANDITRQCRVNVMNLV